MKPLRKEFICPCCNGKGVQQNKYACQAYKRPYSNGSVHQCNLEGRYDLDGVHYCGSHLKQELRKQKRLDELNKYFDVKEKIYFNPETYLDRNINASERIFELDKLIKEIDKELESLK